MNSRAFTLSLVIAGIAMSMVYTYMEGRESTFVKKYGQEVAVVIAKVDIKELELLDDSKVTIKKIPRTFLAPKAIKDIKQVFNSIATVPIIKGEQITAPRITTPSARTGLSRQVAIGKRAFSLNVDNSQAVTKLIKPGDRVDVLARIDYSGGRKDIEKIKTILQDVLIISTGLSMTNSVPLVKIKTRDGSRTQKLNTYTNYATVTLEVTPYQAQELLYLVETGARPYLTLRNNDDKEIVRIKGTKLFDVLGDDANEAKAFFNQNNKRGGN